MEIRAGRGHKGRASLIYLELTERFRSRAFDLTALLLTLFKRMARPGWYRTEDDRHQTVVLLTCSLLTSAEHGKRCGGFPKGSLLSDYNFQSALEIHAMSCRKHRRTSSSSASAAVKSLYVDEHSHQTWASCIPSATCQILVMCYIRFLPEHTLVHYDPHHNFWT